MMTRRGKPLIKEQQPSISSAQKLGTLEDVQDMHGASTSKMRRRPPDLQCRCSIALFNGQMKELSVDKATPFAHFLFTPNLRISTPRLKAILSRFRLNPPGMVIGVDNTFVEMKKFHILVIVRLREHEVQRGRKSRVVIMGLELFAAGIVGLKSSSPSPVRGRKGIPATKVVLFGAGVRFQLVCWLRQGGQFGSTFGILRLLFDDKEKTFSLGILDFDSWGWLGISYAA
ncbi:hypothetical protein Droror1_Dr00014661 [Drosera rotundifolia]